MEVLLRSQGGILDNVAILLRCHCVHAAVAAVVAVLFRCLYGNGVSTEIALRCFHGATAGIFCNIKACVFCFNFRKFSTSNMSTTE